MAQEKRVLVVCHVEAVLWPIVRRYKEAGWQVQAASNLPSGMRIFEANPIGFDLVIMDEDHGCENGSFRDVLAGLREIRCLNGQCVVIAMTTIARSKVEVRDLKEWVNKVIDRKSWPTLVALSAQYFKK
ncbi:MAG: response regulator [Patescibacteria group bacterium]